MNKISRHRIFRCFTVLALTVLLPIFPPCPVFSEESRPPEERLDVVDDISLSCCGEPESGTLLKCRRFFFDGSDPGFTLQFGRGRKKTLIDVSAWVECGVMTNSHGAKTNGPNHISWLESTDFEMSEIWLFAEKKVDGKKGFDWGFRTDFTYGMAAPIIWSPDQCFDYGWGSSKYGSSIVQLYGEMGYRNFKMKIGRIGTPIGWEETLSVNNFFYSHSNVYYFEPSTHSGFLAEYTVDDRFTVCGGWVCGLENWFSNRYGDDGFLGGFSFEPFKDFTIYYYLYTGDAKNAVAKNNEFRFGDHRIRKKDYYIQSLCFEWTIDDRWYYMFQYDLNNTNATGKDKAKEHKSCYGINQHLIYTINDRWGIGFRAEWFRDNGGYITETASDYLQMTLGLNWRPCKRLSIRPEIRYDRAFSATPFGDRQDRSDQVSGGVGLVYQF